MALSLAALAPWTDRAGRFSWLKAGVLAAAVLPATMVLAALASGNAGPRPWDFAVHETGEWGLRFLLASLCVSPARRILNWPALIQVRRMLGLAAFAYAAVHVVFYVVDLRFDLVKVATEIALRVYLLVGFLAFSGLVALAATSTDGAIRRLGRNWQRLHRIAYVVAVLAILHHFMQTKIDVFVPTLHAGVFVLLMAYRGVHAAGRTLSPSVLAAIAVGAFVSTMALEYAWYALATNVPADRVLAANASIAGGVRPAWWIAAAGLAVTVLALVRGGPAGVSSRLRPDRRAPRRT